MKVRDFSLVRGCLAGSGGDAPTGEFGGMGRSTRPVQPELGDEERANKSYVGLLAIYSGVNTTIHLRGGKWDLQNGMLTADDL
jgi:hypothetical protein